MCIAEGEEWKAAFTTEYGLFEPTVMFFGLTNSPATFQHMMDNIFVKELDKGWLLAYMDDTLIATEDELPNTLHVLNKPAKSSKKTTSMLNPKNVS